MQSMQGIILISKMHAKTMPDKKTSTLVFSPDYIWALILLALAAFCAYKLYGPQSLSTSSAKALAIVNNPLNNVQSKAQNDLTWSPAKNRQGLLPFSQVYTGELAQVSLEIKDKGPIHLGPNTLIKIGQKQDPLTVDKGAITASLSNGQQLKIKMGQKELALKSSNALGLVQIVSSGENNSLNQDNFQIEAVDGDVAINLGQGQQVLKPGDELQVTGSKSTIHNYPLLPLTPSPSQLFYFAQSQSVEFSFRQKDASSLPPNLKLQISKDQNFKEITWQEVLPAKVYKKQMQESGLWYWRIVSEDNKILTPLRWFQLKKEQAAQIIRPKNGTTFEQDSGPITLEWDEGHTPSILEWKKGDGPINRLELSHSLVQLKGACQSGPCQGQYFWRVKINSKQRSQAIWSSWQSFELLPPRPQAKATLLYPRENEEIINFKEKIPPLTFSWSWPNVESLKGHSTFELYSEQNPQTPLLTSSTNKQNLTWDSPQVGNYLWVITHPNGELKATGHFKMTDAFKVDSKPQDGIQIELKRPNREVAFSWEKATSSSDSIFAQDRYIFELSPDANFEQVLVSQEVDGTHTKVQVAKLGTYYWRTKKISKSGQVLYTRPSQVIITPGPKHLAPLIQDKEINLRPKKYPRQSRNLWQHIVDFFIPQVFAQDEPLSAVIDWPASEEAKLYWLQIANSPDDQEFLIDQKLNQKFFEWTGANPGTYWWRLAVIDYWDRAGPFGPWAKLTVKLPGEFADLQRARLLSPRHDFFWSNQKHFSWRPVPFAISYSLQLATSEDFNSPFINIKTEQTKHELTSGDLKKLEQKISQGPLFWRVLAHGKINQKSISVANRLQKAELPKPVRPSQNKSIAKIKKTPNARARINWLYALAFSPHQITSTHTYPNFKVTIDGRALLALKTYGQIQLGEKSPWSLLTEVDFAKGKLFSDNSVQESDYTFLQAKALGVWSTQNRRFQVMAGILHDQHPSFALASYTQVKTEYQSSTIPLASALAIFPLATKKPQEINLTASLGVGDLSLLQAQAEWRIYRPKAQVWFLRFTLQKASWKDEEASFGQGEAERTMIQLSLGLAWAGLQKRQH